MRTTHKKTHRATPGEIREFIRGFLNFMSRSQGSIKTCVLGVAEAGDEFDLGMEAFLDEANAALATTAIAADQILMRCWARAVRRCARPGTDEQQPGPWPALVAEFMQALAAGEFATPSRGTLQ